MRDRDLTLLLCTALAVRLWLAFTNPGASYDIESYRIQAEALLSGQNIYTATFRYPYPPLWMYAPAAALSLSKWTNLPFHFWVKLPAVVADLGIGWLLFRWPQPRSAISGRARATLYLFNPVSLLISAAHGQFDAAVIFFTLLAARFLIGHKNWSNVIGSALSLGVAIALKGFPVLLLPVFVLTLSSRYHALLYVVLVGSVFGLVVLPYLAVSGRRILTIILVYNSTPDHSYAYLLNNLTSSSRQWLDVARSTSRWLQGGATAITTLLVLIHRWPLEWRITLVLLAVYAVSPGLASQQMVWVLPFLILTRHRSIWIYTTVSSLALIWFYGQYFPTVILLSTPWSGEAIAVLRLGIEAGWWLSVVGILLTLRLDYPVSDAQLVDKSQSITI